MCRTKLYRRADRPIITATLILPRLNIAKEIPFLIDTGADTTSLGGLNSFIIGLHPDMPGPDVEVDEDSIGGVGGDTECHVVREPLIIAFQEKDERRELWSLHLEHKQELVIIPGSKMDLLGRDILDRFAMEYNPGQGYVQLDRDDFGGGQYECMTLEEEPSKRIEEWTDDN